MRDCGAANGSLKAWATRGTIVTFRKRARASACWTDLFKVLVGHQKATRKDSSIATLRFYT
jgi:hypothetical protein